MRSPRNTITRSIKLQIATVCLALCMTGSGMAAEPEVLPTTEISISRLSPEFVAAQTQARSDASDPRSRDWSREATPKLANLLTPLLRACEKGMMEFPTVTVLIRMSTAGKSLQVLSSDKSPYGECLRKTLQSLDQGSAPWEGYWNEIVLRGSSRPPPLLTVIGDSCKAADDQGKSAQPSLVVTKTSPSAGTAVTKDAVISVTVAYSVRSTTGKYMIMARFASSTPGNTIGDQPIAFALPATCGKSGTFTAEIRPAMFWNIPFLGSTLNLELAVIEGEPTLFYPVANSIPVGFPRR